MAWLSDGWAAGAGALAFVAALVVVSLDRRSLLRRLHRAETRSARLRLDLDAAHDELLVLRAQLGRPDPAWVAREVLSRSDPSRHVALARSDAGSTFSQRARSDRPRSTPVDPIRLESGDDVDALSRPRRRRLIHKPNRPD